jgi:hypothetical protein
MAVDQVPGDVIPGAGMYTQQMALAQQAYELALADIARRRAQLLHNLGFRQTGSGLEPDWKNPYGQYWQHRRRSATDLERTENSSIARGLGLEGAGLQPVTNLRHEQRAQDAAFMNAAQTQMGDLAHAQMQALMTRNWAFLQAQQQAAIAAQQSQQFGPGQQDTSQTATSSTTSTQGHATPAQTQRVQTQTRSAYQGAHPNDRPGPLGHNARPPWMWGRPAPTTTTPQWRAIQQSRQRWGMH